MNWPVLSRLLGMLGMLVGGSMIFSLPWALPVCGQTAEFEAAGFGGLAGAIVCSLAVGGTLYSCGRREPGPILRKEALAIVGLGWILAGILGSLPYLFSGTMRAPGEPMTVADALFESFSGFTTTGASVLTQVEAPSASHPDSQIQKLVPRCVLFWRSFTHWLGGMGIIVLFVAILRQLGAGGKTLMRREVPGPMTESIRPRVRETAIVLWSIYMGFSAVLSLLLFLEGMSVYDALCHTFGALPTGGFSTYNDSIAHFQSPLIEATIVVFMIIGGTNFSLYYLLIRPRESPTQRGFLPQLAPLYQNPEFQVYMGLMAAATVFLSVSLLGQGLAADLFDSTRQAGFQVVSIMTATGFATANFADWSETSKGVLLLLMFIGGCAGSTSGGTKVIRIILFVKVVRLEIEQAFRPKVVRPFTIFGRRLDPSLRHEVLVYISMVVLVGALGWLGLIAIEPIEQWHQKGHTEAEKLIDCASAVLATMNTVGPGLGVLGPTQNYADFAPQSKLLMTLLMVLGRLELFAILVLFFPSFWRTH